MKVAAAARDLWLAPRRYRPRGVRESATLHASNPGSRSDWVNPAARIQSVQPARQRSMASMVFGLKP